MGPAIRNRRGNNILGQISAKQSIVFLDSIESLPKVKVDLVPNDELASEWLSILFCQKRHLSVILNHFCSNGLLASTFTAELPTEPTAPKHAHLVMKKAPLA